MGREKSGHGRAMALTAEERSKISRDAAKARWGRQKAASEMSTETQQRDIGLPEPKELKADARRAVTWVIRHFEDLLHEDCSDVGRLKHGVRWAHASLTHGMEQEQRK